ncbi:BTAD domain-containing putative transcriptional regulator, partial [Streptomyces glaucescens]|uniref:BTAD domain-containing putative transcriptional regulator n=1 Tax=Streptomyces glaucescens TaxID=1907 RepID=UPI002481B27B
ARTARTRLLQLRLTLHRTRAELDLDLDEVARAAADLAELVRAHPSQEDFRRLYLIALRRQGRLEEALEVFEEYELSGGTSPELLTLGQELREEFGGPPEDHGTPPGEGPFTEPDDLPAGSFPTEQDLPSLLAQDEELQEKRPLPRDEVPESLFAEEAAGPDRARLVFRFADGPRDADTHALLGRAITRLIAASDVDAAEFPLAPRDDGFSVPVRPGGSGWRLLQTLTLGFRDLLAELDGVRLHVGHGADPDGSAQARRALASPEVHGVLVVGPGLGVREGITRYERPERLAPPPPVRGP